MAIPLQEILKKNKARYESMTPEERKEYHKKARKEYEQGINKINEEYADFFKPRNIILGQPKQIEESKFTYVMRTIKRISVWLTLLIVASGITSIVDYYVKMNLS